MNRDENMVATRPTIDLPADGYHSEMEQFQNMTLRPILKLQHTATSKVLLCYKNFQKSIASAQSQEQYNEAIAKLLKTDIGFRSTIVGMIIGHFTTNEFEFYVVHKSDVNKRIISMQIKRFASEFYSLKAKV